MPSSLTRALMLGATIAVASSTTATAQLGARSIPATYAITGARIVPVAGPAIERGTIVIRDGLIAAVGPAVTAPADARVIDGTGLTVYPGFIDALSNIGVPASRQQGGGGFGGGFLLAQQNGPQQPPLPSAPNSLHPVGLQPELRAID